MRVVHLAQKSTVHVLMFMALGRVLKPISGYPDHTETIDGDVVNRTTGEKVYIQGSTLKVGPDGKTYT